MEKLRAELPIAAKVVVQDGIEKLTERKSSRNTNNNSDGNHEMVEDEEQFILGLSDSLFCLQGFEVGFPMTVEVLKIAITLGVS